MHIFWFQIKGDEIKTFQVNVEFSARDSNLGSRPDKVGPNFDATNYKPVGPWYVSKSCEQTGHQQYC